MKRRRDAAARAALARAAGYIVREAGPWSVKLSADGDEVFVASDDFTHDVWMRVNGDFATVDQEIAYAEEIARRLNEAGVS